MFLPAERGGAVNRKSSYLIFVLSVLLMAMVILNYQEKRAGAATAVQLENQYRLSFYQLVDDVENLEISLAKSLVSNSPKEISLELSHIWRSAYEAQDNLARLPVENMGAAQKFFTQVADFSYHIAEISESGIPADLRLNLEKIYLEAKFLSANLHELEMKAQKDSFNWYKLQQGTSQKISKISFSRGFAEMQNRLVKYPGLIYDGPFSNHIKKEVLSLDGKIISTAEAKEKADGILKTIGISDSSHLKQIGENKGLIPSYLFEHTKLPTASAYAVNSAKQTIYLELSQKGGEMVSLISDREIKYQQISFKQALKRAQRFLQQQGYKQMVLTSYIEQKNTLIFSFVYRGQGVVYYPDLVKVKVALDNGEVMGFEGRQYLLAHHERKKEKPMLTAGQAEKLLNPEVAWEKTQLVLIPKEGKKEILCYECRVKMGKTRFLVYLNAQTGEEEEILRLIEGKNLLLAM